jgi:hypothetical protein
MVLADSCSQEHISMITGLLERDITKRLGCSNEGRGFQADIKTHAWLKGIDWNGIENKTFETNFKPPSKSKSPSEQQDFKSGSVLSMTKKPKMSDWVNSKVTTCPSFDHSGENGESREVYEMWLIKTQFHSYDFEQPQQNETVEMPACFLQTAVKQEGLKPLIKRKTFETKSSKASSGLGLSPLIRRNTDKPSKLAQGLTSPLAKDPQWESILSGAVKIEDTPT